MAPHPDGVDGVVNDDNPRPHSSSFPPTETEPSTTDPPIVVSDTGGGDHKGGCVDINKKIS